MKNKNGQVSIFIILALFLIGVVVLVTLLKDKQVTEVDVRECEIDSDCVPAECCDAQYCVSAQEAPNCDGEGVDFSCRPGCRSFATNELGCRDPLTASPEGTCQCVNQECVSVFS